MDRVRHVQLLHVQLLHGQLLHVQLLHVRRSQRHRVSGKKLVHRFYHHVWRHKMFTKPRYGALAQCVGAFVGLPE